MPVALTVDVGWPWWAITAIASGVFGVCVLVAVASRHQAVRAAAAILALEGAAIAIVAPWVMPNMNGSSAAGDAMVAASSVAVIHVIEHAPAPDMQMSGSVQTFANPVFDSTNAKKIGRDQGICAHIGLTKAWECVWTTFLPGGQITAEGPETASGGTPYPFAITGGTAKYANARGWLGEKEHNKAGTEFDEFFHLSGGG